MKNFFSYNNWKFALNYIWALLFIIFIIVGSNVLVTQLKQEEENKVDLIADAYKLMGTDTEIDTKVLDYLLEINDKNESIPILILDSNDEYVLSKNVPEKELEAGNKLTETIASFKKSYKPIEIDLIYDKQFLYYKNSELLTQLAYYPYLLILLIFLFFLFTYWYFRTLRRSEQSYLWAGLAKETAHQIGTPLSSIMGWLELLKLDPKDENALVEIENDVERLQFITDRFSKIGSQATLSNENLIETTEQLIDYLEKRISQKVKIKLDSSGKAIMAQVNLPLFNWVLENLIKNAVDSLKNEGNINIAVRETSKWIDIDVSDNGPGIARNDRKRIFQPGYSTKKRGWGLGLSLAKRIIENYHKGKIFVLKSEPNRQTTLRIMLKKS